MVSLYWRNPLQFEGAGSAGNTSCGSDRTDVAATKTTTLTTMRPLLLDMNPATALAERRIRSTANLDRPHLAESININEAPRGLRSRVVGNRISGLGRLGITSNPSQLPKGATTPVVAHASKTASDAVTISESSTLTRRIDKEQTQSSSVRRRPRIAAVRSLRRQEFSWRTRARSQCLAVVRLPEPCASLVRIP